jgi:Tfp pilus assembly protein PilV
VEDERGWSLAELVVSMLVLTVGILALAGTAGQVTRLVGWGGRYGAAAVLAGAAIEQLRATPCASLASSGSASAGIYSLSWTVTASGGLRAVAVTVTYPNGRTTRSDLFETLRSCA